MQPLRQSCFANCYYDKLNYIKSVADQKCPGCAFKKRWNMIKGYRSGIPLEAQSLYRKAKEMKGRGKPEVAQRYLWEAVLIAPAFVNAFLELGNCCDAVGNSAQALVWYDRAILIDPSRTEALSGKAMILKKMEHEKGEIRSPEKTAGFW